jgi:hypothetical protein
VVASENYHRQSREFEPLHLSVCAVPNFSSITTTPSPFSHSNTLSRKMPSPYSTNLSELCRHETWRVGCLSCKQHHTMRQRSEVSHHTNTRILYMGLTTYRPKQSSTKQQNSSSRSRHLESPNASRETEKKQRPARLLCRNSGSRCTMPPASLTKKSR